MRNYRFVGSTHLEKQGTTLFMDLLVFPEFQDNGGKETNIASLKLFEDAGFIRVSKEDELIKFVYQRRDN